MRRNHGVDCSAEAVMGHIQEMINLFYHIFCFSGMFSYIRRVNWLVDIGIMRSTQ